MNEITTAANPVDLLLIGDDRQISERCQNIAKIFEFNWAGFNSVDQLFEQQNMPQPKVLILLANKLDAKKELANLTQVAKQCCPESYVLAVVDKRIDPETAVFAKKSGANCVLLDSEVIESSKLEFIVMQAIRSAYVGVKSSDFKEGVEVNFNIFHLLPMNRKFLLAVRRGDTLSESKRAKMLDVSEVYIRREEVSAYTKYIQDNTDKSAEGLKSRCRAQFMALTSAFIVIVLLITDQSEASSFDAGRLLFDRCFATAKDLMINLGAVGNAWDVVTNSAIGNFGSIDRSPAVAANAGLLSLLTGIGQPDEVVLAALLCDVGTLNIHPSILNKMHLKIKLKEQEQMEYERHPIFSVNMCLARKLPLTDQLRATISMTHERADGKGFQKIRGEKVPIVSQLIRLSQLIDEATSLKWGEARKNPDEVRSQIINKSSAGGEFSPTLISKVKAVC